MAPVTKIYELKSIGYDQLIEELENLTDQFLKVKKAKQAASLIVSGVDKESQDYKDASKSVHDLTIKELELTKTLKEKRNEAKVNQIARQEEINKQKEAILGNNEELKSIRAIRLARSELNALVVNADFGTPISFRGNTLGYDEAVAKLKKLSDAEQSFRRQFQKDGTLVGEYTTGIIQAFKKLGVDDLVTGQLTRSNVRLKELNSEFNVLKSRLQAVKEGGAGSFDEIERELIANRKEAIALENEVKHLNTSFRGIGDIGNQITTGLANGFKNMRGQLAQFVLSYVGIQAAFQGLVSSIDTVKELSDETTNLEVELGKAAGGADGLVKSLAGLNTRTQLSQLEAIANIAAKAGVSEQNLAGVTEALDKIKIAFGKDFGEVEEGTESLVKLINVFEGTDQVTGDNLLRVGNAIRTLANESVASVPFLNDFAKRMAGLKGIADISLPSVLGLASGFEQLGQSSEVSGTALTTIIPKLGANIEKYAQIANITKEAFSDLLKNNPAEALIKVAEALVKSKTGVEEISKSLAGSDLAGAARTKAILGTLGANAEVFRKAITSAGEAYADTGEIVDAFNAKNNNLAATLDKVKKAFVDAANSEVFKAAINAVSQSVLVLVRVLTAIPTGVVLTGLGLLTAAWAFYKGNVIAATLAQSANNSATLLGSVRLGIMRSGLLGAAAAEQARAIQLQAATAQRISSLNAEIAATTASIAALEAKNIAEGSHAAILQTEIAQRRAHVLALEAEVIATRGATVATEGLNLAVKASPLGIILTLVAIAVPAFAAFGNASSEAAERVSKLNAAMDVEGDIQVKMREETTKTKNSVNELIGVIKDETSNQSLRQHAYEQLIKISPDFIGTLDGEYKATEKLNQIYDTYIGQLDKVSRAEAIRNVKRKVENERAEKENAEFAAKIAADQETAANKPIEDANAKILLGAGGSTFAGGANTGFANIRKVQTAKREEYKKAKAEAEKARKAALDFTEFMKNASEDDKKAVIEGTKPVESPGTELQTVGGTVSIKELRQQFANINTEIADLVKLKGRTDAEEKELKELRAKRKKIIQDIKDLGGSIEEKRSTVSPATSNAFSVIDTKLKTDLAIAETTRIETQKIRNLTFKEEENYIVQIRDINIKYLDEKIKILGSRKRLDIAEKEQLATFIKEKADLELQSINKVKEIQNKEFNERTTVLRNNLDEEVRLVKEQQSVIQNDPTLTATDKAQKKLESDQRILELYKKFNEDVNKLEQELRQQTTRNSREIVKAQQQTSKEIIEDRRKFYEAQIEDIRTEGEAEKDEYDTIFEQNRQAILSNETYTDSQRRQLIERLSRANNITILSKELEILTLQLRKKALMYAQNLISEAQYNKDRNAQKQAAYALEKALEEKHNAELKEAFNRRPKNVVEAVSKGVRGLFGVDEESKDPREKEFANIIGQATADAFNLAGDAMHQYYDSERARIQQSLDLNIERLNLEKEQVKARATSNAQREALDIEYANREKALRKAAGEETKRTRKAELRIALATEIGNIAVSVARLGPIFGPIAFGILSAIALARYGLGVAAINAQQFAKGGAVPQKGGKFGGKPHAAGGTPFQFKEQHFEAEVDELAIIRTRNAPARNKIFQIVGTHQQIASQLNVLGGGVQFAPGAKLKKFEYGGSLAKTLQAPVFIPSTQTAAAGNNNGELVAEIRELRRDHQRSAEETSKRIDRIRSEVSIHDIRRADNKVTKQTQIGTL